MSGKKAVWRLGAVAAAILGCGIALGAVECGLEFAPLEGVVRGGEKQFRREISLNGLWQMQPVWLPPGYERDKGVPPPLPLPRSEGWAETRIRIPSHWNVNNWGGGRLLQRNPDQVHWPDSLCFPSYPVEWDGCEMGWLRRSFSVPQGWRNQRVVLHFEGVAGECQVWLNGTLIGDHFDSFLPFEFDLTQNIDWQGENELLVGIRSQNLFNKRSAKYGKFLAPYPPGSNMDILVGIWQDVSLLSLPLVGVEDVFVKPLVGKGMLEIEVTVANHESESCVVGVAGAVSEWLREGNYQEEFVTAPWRLGERVLELPPVEQVEVAARGRTTVVVRQECGGRLKLWCPGSPQLYAAEVVVQRNGVGADCKYTRFGWREFTINGAELRLNGEKIQLFGDLIHPFGVFMLSPRTAWAWYRMVQDMGGNVVRPHAQIYPRFYMELADEMGMVVLDETAVFGSSIRLNPEEEIFWQRYAEHFDGLIRRDRNHPSVVGWSFGNEMFAIPLLNKMSSEDVAVYNDKLRAIGARAAALDPTRGWVTCDGDEDLGGALPVWSKHFGHGRVVQHLPKGLNKPLKVGESGGTYYATPLQLAEFNGDRAFMSYQGRSEALAIDVYDNIVNMALPHLSYYSPSEVVWFGLEHLNLGYRDFSRMPGHQDGVFFTAPYQEGKPGMQPERIAPYVTPLNPGWDPELPLYKPLAMFEAIKAALAKGGPAESEWSRRSETKPVAAEPAPRIRGGVGFVGGAESGLRRALVRWGVEVSEEQGGGLLIVDGEGLGRELAEVAVARGRTVLAGGGSVVIMVHSSVEGLGRLQPLLPYKVELSERLATQVEPCGALDWLAGFGMSELYFAHLGEQRYIMRHGVAGEFGERGEAVLRASNVDWSLFNERPEFAKVGSVMLYERLEKGSGVAVVRSGHLGGRVALSTLDWRVEAPEATRMWRRLFSNMGVGLAAEQQGGAVRERRAHDLLLDGPME